MLIKLWNHQHCSYTRTRKSIDLAMPPKSASASTGHVGAKAKTKSTGLSRRKQGRLSVLPTQSLDILFEVSRYPVYCTSISSRIDHPLFQIFGHLYPVDLLHLSRVSKSFRQVLMTRTSAWLWRSTFSNMNGPSPPPRPEGMSEPAWVHLLFGGAFCDASSHLLFTSAFIRC